MLRHRCLLATNRKTKVDLNHSTNHKVMMATWGTTMVVFTHKTTSNHIMAVKNIMETLTRADTTTTIIATNRVIIISTSNRTIAIIIIIAEIISKVHNKCGFRNRHSSLAI